MWYIDMAIHHIDMVILDIHMGDDSIDTVISHIDMGSLVSLPLPAHDGAPSRADTIRVRACRRCAAEELLFDLSSHVRFCPSPLSPSHGGLCALLSPA
jgi:hypothetical protein